MCDSSWTKFVFAPHTQQEEERRRQKIEVWENMQQGKSSKGHKLSEVSSHFWIEFLSTFPSSRLGTMSPPYFSPTKFTSPTWGTKGAPSSGRIFNPTFSQTNVYETLSSAGVPRALWSDAGAFRHKGGLVLDVSELLTIAFRARQTEKRPAQGAHFSSM